jgi:hypothetical protein
MNPMRFGESIEIGVSNRELEFNRLEDGEVDVRMTDGKHALSKDWVSVGEAWTFPKDDRKRPESIDDNEFSSKKDALMDGLLVQKLDDIPSDEKKPNNKESKKVVPPAKVLENVKNTQIKNKKDEFNNMRAYYDANTGEFTNGFDEWFLDENDDRNTPKCRQMNRTARNIITDNVIKNSDMFSNIGHKHVDCPDTSKESTLNCAINYTPQHQEFLDTIKNMKMDRNLTIKIKYNHENMKETRVFKFY